jgi:hypothetical protein
MKTPILLSILMATMLGLLPARLLAQGFNSGSTEKDGALSVTNTVAPTTINLPPDGILNYTTINISPGATLRFKPNALNTPVYLLATGDVVIQGIIDVSGGSGTSTSPGKGGPGGFDGGSPGLSGTPPGDGKGPGAGKAGNQGFGADGAGVGVYGAEPAGRKPNDGALYGSPLLVPLLGGSGGGGHAFLDAGSIGGGGGGGAILIASNTRISLPEPPFGVVQGIFARGGGPPFNNGSGGAIRLVAPVVQCGPHAQLDITGSRGCHGRLRIDAIDKSQIPNPIVAASQGADEAASIGSFMTVFPPNNPRLDVIQAAGTTIPEGTAQPVTVNLPFGADPNRTVTVQAKNFKAVVPIEVVLTPDNGPSLKLQAQIDNTAANPASLAVPVTFPINTPVTVNAWIR